MDMEVKEDTYETHRTGSGTINILPIDIYIHFLKIRIEVHTLFLYCSTGVS